MARGDGAAEAEPAPAPSSALAASRGLTIVASTESTMAGAEDRLQVLALATSQAQGLRRGLSGPADRSTGNSEGSWSSLECIGRRGCFCAPAKS
mmetsp:Transcript_110219/g.355796  ORF Transcript_110219/g.355796 Transcript_110219/m.355796 type:complete len:94 (+) Transcript_110219:1577-1858(+)